MRISDWSSDVCSSHLSRTSERERARSGILAWLSRDSRASFSNRHCRACPGNPCQQLAPDLSGEVRCRGSMGPRDEPEGDVRSWWRRLCDCRRRWVKDRKSGVVGKSVYVRLVLGGRRIIKKKQK